VKTLRRSKMQNMVLWVTAKRITLAGGSTEDDGLRDPGDLVTAGPGSFLLPSKWGLIIYI
jgi:hypothetical protein